VAVLAPPLREAVPYRYAFRIYGALEQIIRKPERSTGCWLKAARFRGGQAAGGQRGDLPPEASPVRRLKADDAKRFTHTTLKLSLAVLRSSRILPRQQWQVCVLGPLCAGDKREPP
jgi:hypothetical protein